jgi:hypothetical protein
VTARLSREQLALAQQQAAHTGGSVFVVPSAEPPAPSPFDFSKGRALSAAAYACTRTWLERGGISPAVDLDTASGLPT